MTFTTEHRPMETKTVCESHSITTTATQTRVTQCHVTMALKYFEAKILALGESRALVSQSALTKPSQFLGTYLIRQNK